MGRHNGNPFSALWKRLSVGIVANRNEYRYYNLHKDPRVMPVIHQWLGGFVVIQQKGDPVSYDEVMSEVPKELLTDEYDLQAARQFCRSRSDRRVVLVDFGQETTTNFLQTTSVQS